MAKIKGTAAQAVDRAKATVSSARRTGEQLATQLAKTTKTKALTQAGKSVAQVRSQAAALTKKVTDKVTGRARKRKRARIAAVVVGAAAAVAAAGVGIARRRKR